MRKIALLGAAAIAVLVSLPAEAGNGSAVGAGIVGFGVGAIVGSALTPRQVYVAPPPPPPPAYYYGPVVYGPPAWSPGWYSYCARYPGFNPNTGYYAGPGGAVIFCR